MTYNRHQTSTNWNKYISIINIVNYMFQLKSWETVGSEILTHDWFKILKIKINQNKARVSTVKVV